MCLFSVDLSSFKFISKLEQLVNVKKTSKHDTRQQGKNATVNLCCWLIKFLFCFSMMRQLLGPPRPHYPTSTIEKIDSLREVTVYGYIHQMEDQLLSLECTQFPHGIILIIIRFYDNKTMEIKFYPVRVLSGRLHQQKRFNNQCILEIDRKLNKQKRQKKEVYDEMKMLATTGQIEAAKKLAKNIVGMKDINENYTELKSTVQAFSNYLDEMNPSNNISLDHGQYILKISRLSNKCGVTCPFRESHDLVCHL